MVGMNEEMAEKYKLTKINVEKGRKKNPLKYMTKNDEKKFDQRKGSQKMT